MILVLSIKVPQTWKSSFFDLHGYVGAISKMRKCSPFNSSTWPREGGSRTDSYDGANRQRATDQTVHPKSGPTTDKKHPSPRDSIGLARLCALTLGTVAIVAATSLLVLLWAGAAVAVDQGDPGQVWKSAVTQGWAPITVTLCAAAIRTAISLQAGVAISMVASILLEKHHVGLVDSAFLSIIRAVSVQPTNLIFSGGRGIAGSLGLVGFPLIIVMSLTILASTFTSSILLSDFGNIAILGTQSTSMIAYGNETGGTTIDVWRSPPVQYPRFAEYTDGSGRAVGDHVDDTGFTLRVPLPMTNSGQRQTLRDYRGPAIVFDNRVVCIAPRNLTFLSLNSTLHTRGAWVPMLFAIRGIAAFDSGSTLPAPLKSLGSEKQLPFFCHVPRTHLTVGLTSNITVCVIDVVASIRKQSSPLLLPPAFARPRSSEYIPPIILIFKITMSTDRLLDWDEFWKNTYVNGHANNETEGYEIPQGALGATREGPWHQTRIGSIRGLEDSIFSVSACVASDVGITYNVTLTSQSDGSEPTLERQGGLHERSPQKPWLFKYNTTAVRQQLDATANSSALSRQQRGVMDLDFTATDWNAPLNGADEIDLAPENIFPIFRTRGCEGDSFQCDTMPSALMNPSRDTDVGHSGHVALFSDTLAETGSPARALQSWLNVMTRQKFYDSLGRFTVGGEARYTHSTQVFAPQQWAGFIGVMAILTCHLLLVAWIVSWFLRATRHTMLGNSWQAVSQVVSDATLPLLQRADDLKDSEVADVIRREMREAGRYGIVRLRKPDRGDRRELVMISHRRL